MIWAAFFGCALAGGWFVAYVAHGGAEARTMCILTATWIGTLAANQIAGEMTPVLYYVVIDCIAIGWLFWNQTRNWQWIPAALFTTMLLTHFIFITGISTGAIADTSRPYQDILAVLGYLQIGSVLTAGMQRFRHDGGVLHRWAAGTDWVLRRRMGLQQNADAP